MQARFLTVAKYEVRQYRRSYFEQFFVFAGILLVFIVVSGAKEGATLDTPSSYGIYRIGYVVGSPMGDYFHYSLTMVPFGSRAEAQAAVSSGAIDVFADVTDGNVTFGTSDSPKAVAALKRLKQVILGGNRDKIYALANANDTLDGILLPLKVRTVESSIDYGSAVEPTVYLHRSRFIDTAAIEPAGGGKAINILDINQVRTLNMTQYLMDLGVTNATNDTIDRSGFTLPEEWEIPFVFKSLYDNMAIVSVSILLSILLTLSFAKEKVNNTMVVLFQTPAGSFDILIGKALPYFAVMALVNLGYSLTIAQGLDALKAFYILTVMSATLASFALFTVMASKNYREVTFMGTLSLMSFLMFIVFPNVFSGLNILSFLSPLDAITRIQNQAAVSASDVFMSLLPYKFLLLSLFSSTLVCFNPENFQNTPGVLGLLRQFYVNLSRRLGGGMLYIIAGVALLVPIVFITQTVMAYLILPLGYLVPYALLILLAAVEELCKVLPFYYSRTVKPWVYGIVAGATFFATEKLFNIYLITMVYSYLPAPYTIFIVKGLTYTLVLHVAVTSLFAYLLSRAKGKWALYAGLVLTTAIHYSYNLYMMRSGYT